MKNEYTEKVILRYPPCQPPEHSCIDYDYDPCESSDDITEKDLAILLKEEEVKLQEEREAAETERLRREQELFGNKRGLNESGKSAKKCKKALKNPFFNNRLDFSSCLPPPPPTPPPQFFPTFDEDEDEDKDKVKCKGKPLGLNRRKKCKKIKTTDKDSQDKDSQDKDLEDSRTAQLTPEQDLADAGETTGNSASEEAEEEPEEAPVERRKCRKVHRPPCRKRSSEISNPFQPRQIPAHQRDIPRTSPLEMPEVERQILLSCKNDCQADCKMGLKKKCKRKRQSSDVTTDD